MTTAIRRSRMLALALVAALAAALTAAGGALASAGDLDPSFGHDGLTTTAFGNGGGADHGFSVAVQRNGKLVVAGSSDQGSPRGTDFALTRYNRDGSLDTSFGSGGRVVTDVGNHNQTLNAVTIQPDGKIVAVGNIDLGRDSTGVDFAVVRYLPNGTLDTSFGGGDGVVTTSFDNSRFLDDGRGVKLLPGGKILAVGTSDQAPASSPTTDEDFALARYNADGTLDTTFGGGDGKVTTSFGPGNDGSGSVDVTRDGRYVVAGESKQPNTGVDFAVARYNPDGTLDTSFSGDGRQTTNVAGGNRDDNAGGMRVQRNGRIVVAGAADTGGSTGTDYGLVRYRTDGSLDPSFGHGGMLTTSFHNGNGLDSANELALQSDGKIVAAGDSIINNTLVFSVARYQSSGSLDRTFSGDGRATATLGAGSALFGYGLAIQRDGKIVVAGYGSTQGSSTGQDFAVARFLGDRADLGVSLTARPRRTTVGRTVTYSARVHNGGPEAATGAQLRIALPSHARFVSAHTSSGRCSRSSARTLTCRLGRLAAGATARVTVRVRATHTGRLRSSATASSGTNDPRSGNNRASATARVIGHARFTG